MEEFKGTVTVNCTNTTAIVHAAYHIVEIIDTKVLASTLYYNKKLFHDLSVYGPHGSTMIVPQYLHNTAIISSNVLLQHISYYDDIEMYISGLNNYSTCMCIHFFASLAVKHTIISESQAFRKHQIQSVVFFLTY